MSTLVGKSEIWGRPSARVEPSNFPYDRGENAKQKMEVPVCDL
jgi:hypothetical protein